MLGFAFRIFFAPVLAFAAGFALSRHWDQGAIAALKLAQAQEQVRVVAAQANVDRAEAAVSLRAAVAEAAAQQKLADQKSAIAGKIHVHVPTRVDARTCIPLGLVRVLDAAVLGADPAGLPLAAGKSDEACAPVAASSVGGAIADNYARARANAEQLNALEAWVRDEHAAAQSSESPSR